MNSLQSINLQVAEKLKDREYREQFFESWAHDEVALQIRGLRKKRSLRQVDIAAATGMMQSAVSRLEQADYSRWGFQTLLRIAKVLDARVRVVLEPAEEVIREYEQLGTAVGVGSVIEAREAKAQGKYEGQQAKRLVSFVFGWVGSDLTAALCCLPIRIWCR